MSEEIQVAGGITPVVVDDLGYFLCPWMGNRQRRKCMVVGLSSEGTRYYPDAALE